ncbi:MAG TPA: hypothetical protein VJT73_02825 [Polyangiaceae bacterium]|nr:hypothetical protein [Polyangiaceae bacterium]
MESFRAALDRLTKTLVSELLDAVYAAAAEQEAEKQQRETRTKPTRILRPAAPPVEPEIRPVVVRHFDIPVGRPRGQRRPRVAGAPRTPRAPLTPAEPQVVKFEVVPHPERKNRRIVMTRLGSA